MSSKDGKGIRLQHFKEGLFFWSKWFVAWVEYIADAQGSSLWFVRLTGTTSGQQAKEWLVLRQKGLLKMSYTELWRSVWTDGSLVELTSPE